MKQSLLPALKKELENSFGRKIVSSRDCLQMVDDIYKKTGYNINANTLRRFFGLVKTNYSASPSTLIILSKYCGFDSIDDIEKLSLKEHSDTSINKEEVLHYLVSLFRDIDMNERNRALVENIVQQTIVFLERNPSLIDKFQREMAKFPAGQYYYYELSVNMDRLNDYYGEGLRYYLRNNDSNEAKVFANSMQIFRYWLTEKPSLMEKHMAEISSLSVNHNFPSHILGRYIAARLYYANARNESIDKILIDATKFHVAIMTKRANAVLSYPYFELAVTEALILTNLDEEGIEYIKRGKSFLTEPKDSPKHPFRIWENIIDNKKQKTSKIIVGQKKFTNDTVNFNLNKRYNNLLSFLYMPRMTNEQLQILINETGYIKFENLYKMLK
jgi:hypothetical protein